MSEKDVKGQLHDLARDSSSSKYMRSTDSLAVNEVLSE